MNASVGGWPTRPAPGRWGTVFVLLAGTLGCGDDGTGPDGSTNTRWIAVAAGENHACGLTQDDTVYCWGSNDRQQLSAPVQGISSFPGLSELGGNTASLTAGSGYTCMRSHEGIARCWGDGRTGQLGNGLAFTSPIPVEVEGGPWTAVSAGAHHACGIGPQGVLCWGGDRYGASLGHALPPQSKCTTSNGVERWWCALEPGAVDAPQAFIDISSGLWQSCALAADGQVYCWGLNTLGQLGADATGECVIPDPLHGDAIFPCSWGPAPVPLPEPAAQVAAGASHGCALGTSGAAYCWGGTALYDGQLGHGGDEGSPEPVRVAGSETFTVIATSRVTIYTHTCAITPDGRAYCWGSNRSGELGSTAPNQCAVGGGIPCALVPQPVETDQRFQSLSVGEQFVCGLTDGGEIWCWGLNEDGQLGDGTTVSRASPAPVLALP